MPTPSVAPATRFPNPESFVVEADTAAWPRPAGRNAPRYPAGARQRRENARVIVAMIIDSTGAVETPSLTLLSPPNLDFDDTVCDYLSRAHFNWRDGRSRRALVVFPLDFTVEGAGSLPPAPDYHELAMQFDAIPRQELVGRLEAERHCA